MTVQLEYQSSQGEWQRSTLGNFSKGLFHSEEMAFAEVSLSGCNTHAVDGTPRYRCVPQAAWGVYWAGNSWLPSHTDYPGLFYTKEELFEYYGNRLRLEDRAAPMTRIVGCALQNEMFFITELPAGARPIDPPVIDAPRVTLSPRRRRPWCVQLGLADPDGEVTWVASSNFTQRYDTLSQLISDCIEDYPAARRRTYAASIECYRAYNTETQQSCLFTDLAYQGPELMPTPLPTPPAPIAPLPAGALCSVRVTRTKPDNRLVMEVNAKPLHDFLVSIGVPLPPDDQLFAERPSSEFRVLRNSTLSTEVFLRTSYPNILNLTGVFNAPPTIQRLKDLCNSAQEVVRSIIEHYQPIDIAVTIHKAV